MYNNLVNQVNVNYNLDNFYFLLEANIFIEN